MQWDQVKRNYSFIDELKPLPPPTDMFTLPSTAQISTSLSLTSSFQREEKTILNVQHRLTTTTPASASSSSVLHMRK
ncbi:unnamed protein product [Rotaria socialis]|uniref:Uncharacterized protein n=1 Tax=Rotaria socialis TaxID=392032 RepID=A0A817PV36_9BILA|nr:unnamed protein product [Rotaria socialis]CAF3739029.1 unnamed protein product [Rotaria socialis]